MPSPLRDEVIERVVPPGLTIAEAITVIMGRAPDPTWSHLLRVMHGDEVVPEEVWRRWRPKPGTQVLVRVVPQNGDVFRIVLSLAIIVASVYLGPQVAALATGLQIGSAAAAASTTFATVSAASTAVIAIGGSIALNALIPPRSPNLNASTPSPTYNIGGTRNTGGAWGVIPWVLGRHRMAPVYLARPYTEVVGSDQYLRVMFLIGYGPVRSEDIRIGETLIGDFEDVEYELREGLPGDPPITLYPGQTFEEALSIYLGSGDDWQVRRTEPDTDEISVDLSFPRGLIDYSKSGKKKQITSAVAVEMRKVGDADWVHVTDLVTTEKRQEPFRRGYRWVVPKGQYDVRLKRTDEEADTGTDRTEWSTLRSIKVGAPYTFRKPLATLTLRIRAQDQLQGVIDTLTLIANSRCPDWDSATGTWITRETSNPASLYRYVLQGPGNAQPRADALINLPALQDWHQHCSALGLEFNMVRDFDATLPSVLDDIAAAGHAFRTMPDGRWSVAIDRPQTEVRQHFTARNSWGFTTEPLFGEIPHCWRVRFVDRDADWDVNAERLVYDDGYDENNATLYEEIQFPGVTEAGRAWKEAKRKFVEWRTRFLAHSTNADREYSLVQRGNLVLGAHPVLGVGLAQGRVKAVRLQGSMVAIELDEAVTMAAGKSYVIRFRRKTLATVLRTVATRPGTTKVVWVPAVGELPDPDDLFLFGTAGKESRRLIVKNIEPGGKRSARLSFVDEAPEIHEVESLTPPPWVPRQPQRDQDTPAVPRIVAVSSGDGAQTVGEDGSILAPVTVGVAPGGGGRVAAARFELRHRPAGSTAPWLTESVAAAQGVFRLLGYEVGDVIELQARSVSTAGRPSGWTNPLTTHTVAARTFTPPDIATLIVTRLASGIRQFAWTIADPDGSGVPPDLAGAVIRYRPGTGWTWADLNPLHSGARANSPWETPEPPLAGTYTFGAVLQSTSGIISANPLLITATLGPGVIAPAPTISTASGTIGNTNPVIAGKAEPLASVKVYVDGTEVATTAADVAGDWSVQLAGLLAGSRTITATQTVNGAASGPSIGIVLTVQWNDPDASGHADFKGNRGWLLGASTALTSIFDVITTSAQLVTMASGALKSIAANALPLSDLGLEVWEARTNRLTHFNAAPTATTGLTLGGDAAATLTVVSDTTALNAGILAGLVSAGVLNGSVYRLDNTAGTADAHATFAATVADTTAHTGSVFARGDNGRLEIGGVSISVFALSSTWRRLSGTRTPVVATEQMRIVAPAGKVVYFILAQLEKGGFATAPIVVAGAAATRNAPDIRRTLAADFSSTEGFIGTRSKIAAGVTGNGVVLSIRAADASNWHYLQWIGSTTLRSNTQVGGANTGGPIDRTGLVGTTVQQSVYGYKAGDFAHAVGGAAPGVDTSGAVPTGTPASLRIGDTGPVNGVIEQIKWGVAKPSNSVIQTKSGWTLVA